MYINFGRIGIILSVLKQCLQILCFLTESDVVFSLVLGTFLGILALLSHLILTRALENCLFFWVERGCSEKFNNLLVSGRTGTQSSNFSKCDRSCRTGNRGECICSGEVNTLSRKG